MNGPNVRKVYYNQDGSADWLKSIVKTVHTYTDDDVIYVESLAAARALHLFYSRPDFMEAFV